MESVFLNLVNLSVNASYLAIAIVLLRFILKKSPKWVNCLLWGLLGLRLVFPFSLESVFSLIPSNEFVDPNMINKNYFDIDTGFRKIDSNVNEYLGDRYYEGVTVPEDTSLNITRIFMIIWLVGMAVLLIYTLVSYIKLRRRVSTATLLKDNIKECETVQSPFVLGLFKPTIYLPYNMDEKEQEYVIAHEKAHLKRLDHLIKPAGFLILAVYWFNPIFWIAYILLCRDIELACDEKVIRMLGADERRDYSAALLSCSVSRKSIAACPLAFGEVGVKERVKSVLSYKKPAFWIIIAAVILSIVTAVCFLTVPKPAGVEKMDFSFIPAVEKTLFAEISGSDDLGAFFEKKEDIQKVIDLVSDIEVSSHEIRTSMAGPRDYTIYFSLDEDPQYHMAFYLNSRCTEIQADDGLKPSYIYRVKNSDEIREKLDNLCDSVYSGEFGINSVLYRDPSLSLYVTVRNYPDFRITDEGGLLKSEHNKNSWEALGNFYEIELTFKNFDKWLFNEYDNFKPSKVRQENKKAWKLTEEGTDRFYYLLLQKNGDRLLALGTEGDETQYVNINSIVSLKAPLPEHMIISSNDDAKPGGNPYFNATVLEVSENSVLVEPFEGSTERKSADKIYLSLTGFPDNYPEMKAGDEIRVVYNGQIAESYPAQINTVFAIYFLEDIK